MGPLLDLTLRVQGSIDLDSIQIIKKKGGALEESYLEDGFILDKKIGVGQPKRIENARIMVANTAMDTDKIKIFGERLAHVQNTWSDSPLLCRCSCPCGLHAVCRRYRSRGEEEDEDESGEDPETQHQVSHVILAVCVRSRF